VTSRPGEVAGARFAQAREALLQVLAVERRAGRAVTVTAGPAVTLEAPPDGRREWLAADAVVLAVGGLIAGGVALDDAAAPGAPAFRLGVDADVRLALGGRALDPVASLHGVDLVELGLTALDRVGVDVDERGRVRVDADRLPTGASRRPGPRWSCRAGRCPSGPRAAVSRSGRAPCSRPCGRASRRGERRRAPEAEGAVAGARRAGGRRAGRAPWRRRGGT
jgi:hypothetical protein